MPLRKTLIVLALLGCAGTVASIAFAQTTPELPAPPPTALTPMQWITVSCAVVGAFGIFMTAVGQGLKLLGTRYPALEATAEHFLAWGADVQKAVALVQASTTAKLAHAAAAHYAEYPATAAAPPRMFPSPIPDPPTANDPFPRPPGNPRGFALVGPMAAIALVLVLGVTIAPAASHLRPVALTACTPAQSATAVTILSDLQKACIAIETALPVVDPLLGLPAATPAEVAGTCNLLGISEAMVQAAMTTSAQSAATVAPKVQARVMAIRAARAAKP